MENLLILRKNAGLTQRQLADKLGVCSNTISQYELGKRKPDVVKLSKLAMLLNCTVDDLLASVKKDVVTSAKNNTTSSPNNKVT